MKKVICALILILSFSFVPLAWSLDGQGAKAFTDSFMRSYEAFGNDRREEERLKLQKKELEYRQQQQKSEQERLELQRKAAEQQQNNSATQAATPGTDKDITQNNGIAWNNFDKSMKLFYLYGFTKAAIYIPVGAYERTIDFNDKEKKQIKQLTDRIYSYQGKKEKNKKMMFTKEEIELWGAAMYNLEGDSRNAILVTHTISDITIGQILAGLDLLYKDFRNVNIAIPDAIYVVKKQIEGLSDEDTEKILLYLRGGKSDVNMLRIKNTEGKIIRRLAFP